MNLQNECFKESIPDDVRFHKYRANLLHHVVGTPATGYSAHRDTGELVNCTSDSETYRMPSAEQLPSDFEMQTATWIWANNNHESCKVTWIDAKTKRELGHITHLLDQTIVLRLVQ